MSKKLQKTLAIISAGVMAIVGFVPKLVKAESKSTGSQTTSIEETTQNNQDSIFGLTEEERSKTALAGDVLFLFPKINGLSKVIIIPKGAIIKQIKLSDVMQMQGIEKALIKEEIEEIKKTKGNDETNIFEYYDIKENLVYDVYVYEIVLNYDKYFSKFGEDVEIKHNLVYGLEDLIKSYGYKLSDFGLSKSKLEEKITYGELEEIYKQVIPNKLWITSELPEIAISKNNSLPTLSDEELKTPYDKDILSAYLLCYSDGVIKVMLTKKVPKNIQKDFLKDADICDSSMNNINETYIRSFRPDKDEMPQLYPIAIEDLVEWGFEDLTGPINDLKTNQDVYNLYQMLPVENQLNYTVLQPVANIREQRNIKYDMISEDDRVIGKGYTLIRAPHYCVPRLGKINSSNLPPTHLEVNSETEEEHSKMKSLNV